MRPITLTLLALSLAAVVVVGQIPTDTQETPAYEPPADRQGDTGQCHALMVKNLYLATDPSDPLQQQYLWAAEAFEKLSEAHQSCE